MGWDGEVVPFTRYEDMASHYVAGMRKVQPHGPYYLGGYSFGGKIAVYMARQLKAAGEEVALLAIMDSYSFLGRHWMTLGMWLERCGHPSGRERWAKTAHYLRFWVRRKLIWLYGRAWSAALFTLWGYYRKTCKTPPLSLRRPDWANRIISWNQADMPPFDGDATYFKAGFDPGSMQHPDAHDTWRELITGELDFVHIPGNHSDVIHEPHVRAVAREVRKALKTARAKVNGKERGTGTNGIAR